MSPSEVDPSIVSVTLPCVRLQQGPPLVGGVKELTDQLPRVNVEKPTGNIYIYIYRPLAILSDKTSRLFFGGGKGW